MRDDYDVPTYVKEKTTETLSEKLDQILKLFKGLEDRVSGVETDVNDLDSKISDCDYERETLEDRVSDLETQIGDLDLDSLYNKVEEIETGLDELKDNLRNV